MGSGRWTRDAFTTYAATHSYHGAKNVSDVYTSSELNASLNPKGVKIRESRDSDDHPTSTPIIFGLDVTGSMGPLAMEIAKTQLNELMTRIYAEKPCDDPQIMFCAIGDHKCDRAPVQVTQFESDIRIVEQLTTAYFEGGGGGNGGESYHAAWYFAARHTDTDAFNKRGRKGFLFTIGDECCHENLDASAIADLFGDSVSEGLTARGLLKEASEKYEVFHLIVGNYDGHGSVEHWKRRLGPRAIVVEDYKSLADAVFKAIADTYASKPADPFELE
jgi:hypothetical protein